MKIRQNGRQSRQGDMAAETGAAQAKIASGNVGEPSFADQRSTTAQQNQLAQMAGESPRVAAQLAAAERAEQGPHVVRQLAQIAGIGKSPIQLLTRNSGTQFPNGVMEVNLTPARSLTIAVAGNRVPSVDARVSYTPEAAAPDADPIRLVQTVRASNSATGAVASWAGRREGRRDKAMTAEGGGVQGGWFVDHTAEALRPRNATGNAPVGDAYADASFAPDPHAGLDAPMVPYRNLGAGNQHGSKAGGAIAAATLKDQPASPEPYKFEAEVVAKGTEAGGEQTYAIATWGFETAIGATGQQRLVTHDAGFRGVPSRNFNAASAKFNEVYRNRGAATSPENVDALRAVLRDPASSDGDKAAARAELARLVDILRDNALDDELPGIDMLEFGIGQDRPPAAPDPAPVVAPPGHPDAPGHDALAGHADAPAHDAAPAHAEPLAGVGAGGDDWADWAQFPAQDGAAVDDDGFGAFVGATPR